MPVARIRRATLARATLGALLAAVAAAALAHGSLQEQIDAVTAQIAQAPSNAGLYLRRGELHRIHEDWDAALADYERAARLAPADDTIEFLRGRTLLEAGKHAPARAALDRYLARHPDHAEALITRARTLYALQLYSGAAADYSRAIDRLPRPEPDLYLARARAELAAGETAKALAGVDAGIARLGPVPALQALAIEIDLEQGRVDAALARLDQVAARSPRKEVWLARRGEILMQHGRKVEARSVYAAALAAIEALPAGARRTKAMVDLEGQVRGALARL